MLFRGPTHNQDKHTQLVKNLDFYISNEYFIKTLNKKYRV